MTSPKMSEERLLEMLAAAEKATPGPWDAKTQDEWQSGYDFFSGPDGAFTFPVDMEAEDAAHITNCDPQTITAIVAELLERRHTIPYAGDEAEDTWRDLALQFDAHRIEALAMLRYVSEAANTSEASSRAGEIKGFLSKPPLSGESVLAARLSALVPHTPENGGGEPVAWTDPSELEHIEAEVKAILADPVAYEVTDNLTQFDFRRIRFIGADDPWLSTGILDTEGFSLRPLYATPQPSPHVPEVTDEMVERACEALSKTMAVYPGGEPSAPVYEWFRIDAQDAVDFGVLSEPKWHVYSDIRGDQMDAYVAAVLRAPMRAALTAALNIHDAGDRG